MKDLEKSMQGNHQIPKNPHHSQDEMANAFQVTDASKERMRRMRAYQKTLRERQGNFEVHQKISAEKSVGIGDSTTRRVTKIAILQIEAANNA